jgi:glycosyltransferase involved in cell wall biosynthesis
MHIAFISPEYPHSTFKGGIGGIGTFTKNLAEQLVNKGKKVTVFVHSQNNEEIYKENGIEIHFVKAKRIRGITWYTNRKYFNNYVNKIIEQQKIEVIEAPEWTGFTAFMKFNCPLILRLHGSDTYFCNLENRKVKFKNKFFEKRALYGATKIVGVSEFVANRTKELFNLNSNIDVVYNTIDTNDFSPNHKNIKPKSLLYFGTLVRKKGVLEIAKMFNKLFEQDDEVTLTFLGKDNKDGFTETSTFELIKELLSNKALNKITHINAVPYNEVIKYIQEAEIVLLPSFAEAFPMTWLEAMALEKKIVTSNIGWANELMIDNITGYIVNPNNINLFATKVLDLLNNKELSASMATEARSRIINEFDIKIGILNNIKLYKSVQ